MSNSKGAKGTPSAEEALAALRRAGRNEFAALEDRVQEALATHLALLMRWNARINLTAIRDFDVALRRHTLESLEALPLIAERGLSGSALADLGSGNGYPALPLLHAQEEASGVLYESTARKTDFLNAVIGKTGLRDRVRAAEHRIRRPSELPPETRIVTMRGFPDPLVWMERLDQQGMPLTLAWLGAEDAREAESRLGARLFPLSTHADGFITALIN